MEPTFKESKENFLLTLVRQGGIQRFLHDGGSPRQNVLIQNSPTHQGRIWGTHLWSCRPSSPHSRTSLCPRLRLGSGQHDRPPFHHTGLGTLQFPWGRAYHRNPTPSQMYRRMCILQPSIWRSPQPQTLLWLRFLPYLQWWTTPRKCCKSCRGGQVAAGHISDRRWQIAYIPIACPHGR